MRQEKMIILILLLALVLRLVNLNQSFWLDEAAQVIESSRPLLQQFDIVADFHPPLFHLMLHFWMYLGNSEIWVRLFSVGLSLFSILMLYKLAVSLKREKEGLLAAFFLSLSPYHIWYSQEARPYMLFVATSMLSTYFLLKRRWFVYSLSLAAALYSLYFAPFLILGHIGYILYFEKNYISSFVKSLFLSMVIFLPWVPSFLQQFEVGTGGFFPGWVDVVSIPAGKAVPLTFAKFIFGKGSIDNNLLYTLVILPVFLIFVYSGPKLYKTKTCKKSLILFFVPFISAAVVAIFIPILAPQRLIFLLPLFYLLISTVIMSIRKSVRCIATILVIVTGLGGLLQYYTDPLLKREQWRQAVAFVEQEKSDNSIALFVFPEPFAPYLWYKQDKIAAQGIAPSFSVTDQDLRRLSSKLVYYNRVYLFQYLTGLTDKEERTRIYLQKVGFDETAIKDFPGVGFIYVFYRKK